MDIRSLKYLLIDCDNTLIDWFSFASKSLTAMAEALSEETQLPLDQVISKIREVYSKYQSIEYPLVIDELFKDHPNVNTLIRTGRKAYSKALETNIRTFPEIPEILASLRSSNLKLIILTDAPTLSAASRLRKSKLISYFDGLIGQTYPHENKFRSEFKKTHRYPFSIIQTPILKPETPLLDVIKPFLPTTEAATLTPNFISNHVAIWGDNPDRDGNLAIKWNMPWFDATYGRPTPEQIQSVNQFSPFAKTSSNYSIIVDKHTEHEAESYSRRHALTSPSDLLKLFL